jgi:hypothetical protein
LLILAGTIGWAFGSNVISDYISLFIVRHWLVKAERYPITSLLVCSMIFILLVVLGYILRMFVIDASFIFPGVNTFLEELHYSASYFLFSVKSGTLLSAIFTPCLVLAPALIVFAWLPLFGISLLLIRLLNLLTPVVAKTRWFLKEGNDHPLIAVGYVAGAIVFVIAVALRFILPAYEPSHAPEHPAQLAFSLMRVSADAVR